MAIDPTIQRVASAMMPTSGVAPTFGGGQMGQPQMPDGSAGGGAPSFHLTPNMAAPPPTQLGAGPGQGNFVMPTVQTGAPTHTPMPMTQPTPAPVQAGVNYLLANQPEQNGVANWHSTAAPAGSYVNNGWVYGPGGDALGGVTGLPVGQSIRGGIMAQPGSNGPILTGGNGGLA